MSLRYLLLATCFIYGTLHAQSVTISGKWTGNAQFLAATYLTEYDLTQHGDQIDGFVKVWSQSLDDSSKYKVNGRIVNSVIELKAIEYVYREGSSCMGNISLQFTQDSQREYLRGKWAGDARFTTCPPLTGGKVKLFRPRDIAKKQEPMVDVENQNLSVSEEDRAFLSALAARKNHALIIAVQKYDDPEMVDLSRPVQDARSLAGVLTNDYYFDPEDVHLLENPTRADIISAFDKLTHHVQPTEQVLVFYAGHGIWDERLEQGYWLPRDATSSSKADWLSNSTIRDYVRGIPSKHTLLISDACFSGGIFKERAVRSMSAALLQMYKLKSRKAITSGTLTTVPDESVFMDYLLKFLENMDGPLFSAEELFHDFKLAVIHNSPNGQVPQFGPVMQAGDEGGSFIFLKR